MKINKNLRPAMAMHDYQVKAKNSVRDNNFHYIMAYMAAGKTVISLTAFLEKCRLGYSRSALMISTKSIVNAVWKQETDEWRHLQNQFDFIYITGNVKSKMNALFTNRGNNPKPVIYMTNFENVTWLTDNLKHYFISKNIQIPFDTLFVDEISKFKNIKSKRFIAFSEILPYFNSRYGLSGTPCSNGWQDFYGQMYIIDRGYSLGFLGADEYFPDEATRAYVGYSRFIARWFNTFNGKAILKSEECATEIISACGDMVSVVEKGNIEGLPELKVIDKEVTLTPAQMKIYLNMQDEYFIELENGNESIEIDNPASLNMKLMGYSNYGVYHYPDPDNLNNRVFEHIHNHKMDMLDELIESAGGESVLIAYQFTSEALEVMRRHKDVRCLSGASDADAQQMIADFQSGKLNKLLLHPAGAAHGLNLQTSCDILIIIGVGYSLEQYDQLLARLQRPNSLSDHVTVYRIITKDTINIPILSNLEHKAVDQDNFKTLMLSYKNYVKLGFASSYTFDQYLLNGGV
jgi:SNF2 family DNA or RNA helicase